MSTLETITKFVVPKDIAEETDARHPDGAFRPMERRAGG
jgi:hypothetical protein